MVENGQIDEDLYSLRATKEYIGEIYNRRIIEKGGAREADGYADALGDVMAHLDRAARERDSERNPVSQAQQPADATPAEWWAARGKDVNFADTRMHRQDMAVDQSVIEKHLKALAHEIRQAEDVLGPISVFDHEPFEWLIDKS